MAFSVFIHRPDSAYDDRPDQQYQFPRQYLDRANSSIGDWIIYYEPVKLSASRGYFAVAKVASVIRDPKAPDMHLALIEPGSYLDFVNPVPFRGPDGLAEQGLLNEHGRISGRAQAAIRPVSPADFTRILALGLDEPKPLLPRVGESEPGFAEPPAPLLFDEPRSRVSLLTSRILRDRVFRGLVLRAYDERCAVTGLKLINGGGRAEVNAAHIRPVDASGPDTVNNGIALSGTAHWMFDRGLISLTDDLGILISHKVNDVDGLRTFINQTGRAYPPRRPQDRPHPGFLAWHRHRHGFTA